MDSNKLILLFNTVKYLKFKQIYYRIYYFFRNRIFKKEYNYKLKKDITPIIWRDVLYNKKSYSKENGFTFLNINHNFIKSIDWNIDTYGKLWKYNLTYFDFLNQEQISLKEGHKLIKNYIQNDNEIIDGKEPYPISLRAINWVKFLSKHKASDKLINHYLYNDLLRLVDNREYHLLANHLLENGFSLFFGAYYFKDEKLYRYSKRILLTELKEQILGDGAHYELSPMYHQIILHRILDCIHLAKLNTWKTDDVLQLLVSSAEKMLGWLNEITFSNGDIPMFGDSTYNIAPTTKQLNNYTNELQINKSCIKLKESGYRKIVKNSFELFLDVGNIQPKYQPGHTHADTFSFELYFKKKPFIVDKGISTYEKNSKRQIERSTESHNTVEVENTNSTEVWGGFRVAKRAKVVIVNEKKLSITAIHKGYLKKYKTLHKRVFNYKREYLNIKDELTSTGNIARFHLHSDYNMINIKQNKVFFNNGIVIQFAGENIKVLEKKYDYSLGFNKTKEAICITVTFDEKLVTTIKQL